MQVGASRSTVAVAVWVDISKSVLVVQAGAGISTLTVVEMILVSVIFSTMNFVVVVIGPGIVAILVIGSIVVVTVLVSVIGWMRPP